MIASNPLDRNVTEMVVTVLLNNCSFERKQKSWNDVDQKMRQVMDQCILDGRFSISFFKELKLNTYP